MAIISHNDLPLLAFFPPTRPELSTLAHSHNPSLEADTIQGSQR